ncbi:MAG: hypothetical protein ACR2ME_01115 [Acidimicrobiia bacterium]
MGTISLPNRLIREPRLAFPKWIDLSHPGADGQPAIRMELEFLDGVTQCRSLQISAVDGGRAVGPQDLEAARRHLFQWMDDVFAAFALRVEKTGKNTYAITLESPSSENFEKALASVTRSRRPRSVDSQSFDASQRSIAEL